MSLIEKMRKEAKSGGGTYWKPKKKGEELFGVCEAIERNKKSKFKNKQDVYTIKTDKSTIRFAANHDGIKPLLASVKIGDTIYIRYTGTVKVKGYEKPAHTYEVAVSSAKE